MFLFGYCAINIRSGAERAINALLSGSYRFTRMKYTGDGISLCIYLPRRKRLLRELETAGVEFSCSSVRGLPARLWSLVKKPGLALGLIFLLAITIASEGVVWDISVSGTEELHDADILDDLEEYGIRLGARISALNIDQICTDYLLENRELSWIRINAVGNCLQVVVREKDTRPGEDGERPSNIVASCDGLIYRVEVVGGQRLVSGGESVLKGQMLVSGLVENENTAIEGSIVENPTYRFERSVGKIFAITNDTVTLEIPMKHTEKRYTGEAYEKKSLIFFSKSINFSFLGRNLDKEYDIIKMYNYIELWNGKVLPVSIGSTLYKKYTVQEVPLTEEEAYRLAQGELGERIASILGDDGILVSKNTEGSCNGDTYTLRCTLCCIRDIGIETPLFSADK